MTKYARCFASFGHCPSCHGMERRFEGAKSKHLLTVPSSDEVLNSTSLTAHYAKSLVTFNREANTKLDEFVEAHPTAGSADRKGTRWCQNYSPSLSS